MSLDLKVQVLSVLLLFSFLKMEGQTRFAVVNLDSIDAYIEVAFFENNKTYLEIKESAYLEIKESAVSYFKETADFHILKHKTLGSSCGLEHPPQVRTEYLTYLENQVDETRIALSDILENCKRDALFNVKKHLQNALKELAQKHEIAFISCTSDTSFQNKSTMDLTSLLLKNLNQNKTILSQRMYFKTLTISLLQKKHSEIELLKYATFKENYYSKNVQYSKSSQSN